MSYLIVSRSFWPNAAAIGEGLMQLARMLSKTDKVSVVTMSRENLSEMDGIKNEVDSNISFFTAKPLTSSSSHIFFRICELVYFSIWLAISLLRSKPSVVYVATNPPLMAPFITAVYCKIFNKRYVYHVQDIHPESTALLINIPKIIFLGLRSIDTWVLNSAYKVITLTEDMRASLQARGVRKDSVILVENPAFVSNIFSQDQVHGIVYSGNAGRLQLMEIVLDSIEQYLKCRGHLKFCFVGAGIYKDQLLDLSRRYQNFSYEGYVDAETALRITSEYRWALLPVMPEVLKYAYPSKIPSYMSANCEIISVTDSETFLAEWVKSSGCGKNVEPSVESLVDYFKDLDLRKDENLSIIRDTLFNSPQDFAKKLYEVIK